MHLLLPIAEEMVYPVIQCCDSPCFASRNKRARELQVVVWLNACEPGPSKNGTSDLLMLKFRLLEVEHEIPAKPHNVLPRASKHSIVIPPLYPRLCHYCDAREPTVNDQSTVRELRA